MQQTATMSPTVAAAIRKIKSKDGGKRAATIASTFEDYLKWCKFTGKIRPIPVSYWSLAGYLLSFVEKNNSSCRSLDNKLSHVRLTCTLREFGWINQSDQLKLKLTIKDLKYQDFTHSNRKQALLLTHIKRINN
jgi:hypothetical protein